ncbi:MAG: rubrerythrin family protein [Chloroflexi bacterium]|nr:rubrerythrin family protein [Chloroflexota bacterium]
MKDMTRKNLQDAFAGESQAHLRYLVYAEAAEREGLANVARLFRAASFSEQIHATNHLRNLGGVTNTANHLRAGADGENFEVKEMYPAYIAVAEAQEEKGALRSMSNAMEAEKVHFKLYTQSQTSVDAKKDAELPTIYVCESCGYTMEGDPPERCPICGAVHTRFRKF